MVMMWWIYDDMFDDRSVEMVSKPSSKCFKIWAAA